jgi:hypothetical protein
MSGWDNTNRGSLFSNDRKEKDSHPDYKGSINIDGVEYWISGWKKKIQRGDKAGQVFVSLSVQEKDGSASKPPSSNSFGSGGSTNGNPSMVGGEDDLPF